MLLDYLKCKITHFDIFSTFHTVNTSQSQYQYYPSISISFKIFATYPMTLTLRLVLHRCTSMSPAVLIVI